SSTSTHWRSTRGEGAGCAPGARAPGGRRLRAGRAGRSGPRRPRRPGDAPPERAALRAAPPRGRARHRRRVAALRRRAGHPPLPGRLHGAGRDRAVPKPERRGRERAHQDPPHRAPRGRPGRYRRAPRGVPAAVRPGVGARDHGARGRPLLMATAPGPALAVPAAAAASDARGPGYRPAWWCRSAHLQTVWGPLFRRARLPLRRERVATADGDFVDLDWLDGDGVPATAPRLVLLHGLEGSSRSHYVVGLLQLARRAGWRGVVLNFRSCSGELNRLPRFYHSGDTADLGEVIARLAAREPGVPIGAVGVSLGGNVLLKWLGEVGRGRAGGAG